MGTCSHPHPHAQEDSGLQGEGCAAWAPEAAAAVALARAAGLRWQAELQAAGGEEVQVCGWGLCFYWSV